MNFRDAALLERTKGSLTDLIAVSQRSGSLYTENPKLVADISRKAKWLQNAIKAFEEFLAQKK